MSIVNKIIKKATQEFAKEQTEKDTVEFKRLLERREAAMKIVNNLDCEIEEFELKLRIEYGEI